MRHMETNRTYLRRTTGVFATLLCLLLIPMVSLAAGFDPSYKADDARFVTDLAFYAGAFSTAVTASVNPTATMAVLSILGAIENAAIYSPDSVFFTTIADFLNGVPIVREVGKLQIANPYAAVFLTLVAAAMIIIHSFAESKIVSEISIDKLDKLIGYISTVAISLLPFVTNDALEKDPPGIKAGAAVARSAGILGKPSGSSGPEWHTYLLAAITVVVISVIYYCVYTCVNNLEVIIAAIPVKGTSFIWQLIKGGLHIVLVLLQIFAPVVSLVVSIILAVAGVLLFRVLSRVAAYYKDVYISTVLARIFKRNDPVPRVEKHVPLKLRKLYPDMEIAMAVYKFTGLAKMPKRTKLWLIKDKDGVYIVRNRLIRKPVVMPWSDVQKNYEGKKIYMESCLRFLRIRTEDKYLELIMSVRYKPEIPMLSELLGLEDYTPIAEQNKVTTKIRNKFRRGNPAPESV